MPCGRVDVCTDCLDRRSVLPALRHGCYRGSRLATLPLAANVALHRYLGTWTKQVDAFIALTEFQRERMIDAGLPADLVHVKPNFYPGNPAIVPWTDRRPSVVFAGRLSAEKGVLALVRAWLMWGSSAPELRIVGEGDLREELERLAITAPEVPIRFLGQLGGAAAQEEIACARLVVLPSECFEGFPMVVQEAFAFGTPAAVSNIGPLPSIVRHGENGVVFAPGEPRSLLAAVRAAWEKAGELERLAAGARRSFEALYTEEANYRMLMAIYAQAVEVSRRRRDAPSMNQPVEDIAGYKVGTLGVQACVTDVVAWIMHERRPNTVGQCRWLACMNPHSYVVALRDEPFSQALHGADWLVPDGAGVVLASKIMGGTIRERVTGSDIFWGVMKELDRLGGSSVFFLGATDETLAAIRARMAVDFPKVRVAGTYSPPFKQNFSDDDNETMVTAINTASPDVLWVGMSAPKQEKWLHEHRGRLNVRFAAAVGAVFDFYTGRVKRSHPIFQRLGLEWLPRLIQEPRRLWKRMFVSAPVFMWHVLRARLRASVNPKR